MKIDYEDKVNLTTSALPDRNKISDTDMNKIKNVVNANSGTLLWTNPNPDSDFAGQSIDFGSTNDFEYYRIIWKPIKNSTYTIVQDIELKGGDTLTQCSFTSIIPYTPGGSTSGYLSVQYRSGVANDEGIAITDCTHYFTNNNTKDDPANNYMIPVKIYGYSFG